MSFFDGMVDENVEVEVDEERITGQSMPLRESNVYKLRIRQTNLGMSSGGAKTVELVLEDPTNPEGRAIYVTEYISSGTAKGGKSTYVNSKTGKTHYLPGYNKIDSLCHLLTGKGILDANKKPAQAIEKRMIKRRNMATNTDEAVEVEAFVELWGKEVGAGVLIETYNGYNNGEQTNECKERNIVDMFFCPNTLRTKYEILAGVTTPVKVHEWKAKWEGKKLENYKETNGTGVRRGTPNAPNKPSEPVVKVDTAALFG